MQPNDRKPFLEIVVGLAELKGKQLSAPGLELYWNAMQAWDLADFRRAANELVRTCTFMPNPSDFEALRKAACELDTEQAWRMALAGVRTAYTPRGYTGGTSGNEAVDRAVRTIGGYGAIAMCDEGKLHFLERRFAEAYGTVTEKASAQAALGYAPQGMLS